MDNEQYENLIVEALKSVRGWKELSREWYGKKLQNGIFGSRSARIIKDDTGFRLRIIKSGSAWSGDSECEWEYAMYSDSPVYEVVKYAYESIARAISEREQENNELTERRLERLISLE